MRFKEGKEFVYITVDSEKDNVVLVLQKYWDTSKSFIIRKKGKKKDKILVLENPRVQFEENNIGFRITRQLYLPLSVKLPKYTMLHHEKKVEKIFENSKEEIGYLTEMEKFVSDTLPEIYPAIEYDNIDEEDAIKLIDLYILEKTQKQKEETEDKAGWEDGGTDDADFEDVNLQRFSGFNHDEYLENFLQNGIEEDGETDTEKQIFEEKFKKFEETVKEKIENEHGGMIDPNKRKLFTALERKTVEDALTNREPSVQEKYISERAEYIPDTLREIAKSIFAKGMQEEAELLLYIAHNIRALHLTKTVEIGYNEELQNYFFDNERKEHRLVYITEIFDAMRQVTGKKTKEYLYRVLHENPHALYFRLLPLVI